MLKNTLQRIKYMAFAAFAPALLLLPAPAAASSTINTTAKVSFTFDDGYTSAVTQAATTLAKYSFVGTDYVITGCVGMTKAPNTCHADTDKTYMSWDQVNQLRTQYGWEIGSHSVTHPYLATSDPDDQPQPISLAQASQEISQSKADLLAHGINATDFASPYGDYNQAVLAQIAKSYASQRGFGDVGYNASPYNQYIIRDQYVDGSMKVATLKGYVDQAIASGQWLVFTFHDIKAKASNKAYDYEYSTANLDQLAAYVKSKSVPVVTVDNGLIKGQNLLTDSTFDNGISNGWTTDSPANFVKDAGNNGNYPSSLNSVAFNAGASNEHLFSPMVTVNPSDTYILQNFINLKAIGSGSVGYYIDEYDSNGAWISGQYKQNVSFPWAQTVGFEYVPTSANVVRAHLQVILPANSGAQGYLDNFEWINKTNNPVSPPPVQTNLMPNGAFDAGISQGWTTDGPSNITADSGNNGSPANPINSIKMTAVTTNTHLFSPKVSLIDRKTYSISTYVNIKQLNSGEIGFYMDEYDANGNWISGKYITGARTVGTSTVSFNYTPTSANVKSASLQIILVGNSGIVAYVDNVVWLQN